MSVFVLVNNSTHYHLPNSILTTLVARWWKYSILQPWKRANKLGQRLQILHDLKSLGIHLKKLYDQRHIKRWINPLISLWCMARRLPLLIALIPVVCPQSGNPHEHWVWGGGGGRKCKHFAFGLKYPFSTTSCQYCILHLKNKKLFEISNFTRTTAKPLWCSNFFHEKFYFSISL